MAETDNRIVSIKFDNAQFENGVSTSIKSIDKLNKALQFEGIGDSFNKISAAANRVDLSGAQRQTDSFFDNLSIKAIAKISVISNLITDVYTKGKKLINDIFVAPRKDGFNEYELKMGSVQTIMASTGAELKEVNSYLEELNEYADRTIYSFSDMTASIGKFTNAGVSLDKAVAAIKGISNEAAVSGANSNEASRAMYNFAQALSAGYVKLIDWKSIENANMATVEFKQQLIDSAVALGTVVKEGNKYRSVTTDLNNKVSELFDSTSMFNDSLSSQWMTTDVLVKTLGEYADETTTIGKKAYAAAQEVKTWSQLMDTVKEAIGSGWAQSFEIIIGDFNEAKDLFTAVNSLLDHMVTVVSGIRNGLLMMWKNNGGRQKLVDSIKELSTNLERASDVAAKVLLGKSYDKILGKNSESVDELSKSVEKYTEAEKEAARNIWYGSNVYGNGEERIKNLTEAGLNVEKVQAYVDELISSGRTLEQEEEQAKTKLEEIKDTAKEVTEELKDGKWSRAFDNLVNSAKLFGKAASNIVISVANIGKTILEAFGKEVNIDGFTSDIRSFARGLVQATGKLKQVTKDNQQLKDVITIIVKTLNNLWTVVSKVGGFALKIIKSITISVLDLIEKISDWTKSLNTNSKLYRAFEALKVIFGKITAKIFEFKTSFTGLLKTSSNGELNTLGDKLKYVKDVLSGLGGKFLDKVVERLESLAAIDFSKMNGGKLKFIFDKIVSLKDKIVNIVDIIFTNFKNGTLFDSMKESMDKLFGDNTLFSKAKDWIGGLVGAIKEGFKDFSFKDVIEGLKIAVFIWATVKTINALKALTKSVESTKDRLLKPVDSLANLFDTWANKLKYESMIQVSKAVSIMVGSMLVLSQVPADQLYSATTGLATVLFALSLVISAMAKLNKAKPDKIDNSVKILHNFGAHLGEAISSYSLAANIASVAILLSVLVKSIKDIVEIYKSGYLVVGLEALAGLMFLIVSSQVILAKAGGKMEGVAASFIAFGISIYTLSKALEVLSKCDPKGLTVGLISIVTLMTTFTLVALAMNNFGNGSMITGAAAGLLLMSVAMAALIVPITLLSLLAKAIGPEIIAIVVGTLAGCLAILAGVAILVSKTNAAAALIIMAGALAIIGTTILALGIGLVPAAAGIIALAAALGVLLVAGLAFGLLSKIMLTGATVMMSLAGVTYVLAKALMVGSTALSLLALTLPILGHSIVTFAETINEGSPVIIDSLKKMIEGIASTVAGSAGMIGYAVAAVIAGVLQGLIGMLPTIYDSLEQSFYMLLEFLGKLIRPLTTWLVSALVKVIDGVANAIADTSSAFAASLINLFRSIAIIVLDLLKELSRGWGKSASKFIGEMVDDAKADITSQMQEASKEANETLEKVGKSGANALNKGTEKGLKENNPASQYKDAITDGINSVDVSSMTKGLSKEFDTSSMMEQFGAGNISAYTDASTGEFNADVFSQMGMDSAEGFNMEDLFSQAGADNTSAYSEEIENFYPQSKAEGAKMTEEGAEGAESNIYLYKKSGYNAVHGFIMEIYNRLHEARNAGAELAKATDEGVRGELDIHSPSRVMMENGMYIVKGLVNGIAKFASGAENTTEELGENVLDSFMSPLQKIVDLVNGTLEYDPTIRPVLDTTQLMADVNTVNSLFGNRSFALAGRAAQINANAKDLTFNTDNQNQNQDVVDAIGELRNDFNEMSAKLDNIQVVMDSGALVGAIAGPMDTALGKRQIYKGRGN